MLAWVLTGSVQSCSWNQMFRQDAFSSEFLLVCDPWRKKAVGQERHMGFCAAQGLCQVKEPRAFIDAQAGSLEHLFYMLAN